MFGAKVIRVRYYKVSEFITKVLPFVIHLFRKTSFIDNFQLCTVVQYDRSVESAEYLMLVRRNNADVGDVFSVDNGVKIQLQPPFVIVKSPRRHKGILKTTLSSLCAAPSKKSIFSLAAEVSPNP